MFRKIIFTYSILLLAIHAQAQIFYTKSAKINFYSKAPLEDIEASNKTADCILSTSNNTIQFSVLIKGFEFPKALMQEHFNENYMESNKYPKATFKGTIVNNSDIDLSKKGQYTVKVKGQLTIHGVSRDIEVTGRIIRSNGIELNSTFQVQLSDYNISIPALVKDKVSNSVRVTVNAILDPLKQ
jgi:hypothetical protein